MVPLVDAYTVFDALQSAALPFNQAAAAAKLFINNPLNPASWLPPARLMTAGAEVYRRSAITGTKPKLGINTIKIGKNDFPVETKIVERTPFGNLMRLAVKEKADGPELERDVPRVFIVGPLSGHFTTLLRHTYQRMLQAHDVYYIDFHNSRDVSLLHGKFDLDDHIDLVIRFMQKIGPGGNIFAVCQPSVPVLAAVALMSAAGDEATPDTMTLMAGPIDSRKSPTKVNQLANEHSIDWFENNLIMRVPPRYAGGFRRVYPGFMQLTGFMTMNIERHIRAQFDLFKDAVLANNKAVIKNQSFYDEYLAVMDLPAEFYLQTVETVFQRNDLALGQMTSRGRRIDPSAIRRTALLTIEGEIDDICGLGQTQAAQDLCSGLRPWMKKHYIVPGKGHYGTFSGGEWEKRTAALIEAFIYQYSVNRRALAAAKARVTKSNSNVVVPFKAKARAQNTARPAAHAA